LSYSSEDGFINQHSRLFRISQTEPLPGQYDKQLLFFFFKLFLSCFESFLGLLPHMLETDLTVLKYRKIPEDLVFKDYEKTQYGPPAVFPTTYIIAQLFTSSMSCVLFRLCLAVQTTQRILQSLAF